MTFDLRIRRLGAAALGITVLGAAAATVSANPAAATGIISAVTTVSCSVSGTNWCISGNNANSGIGVIGTSKSGTGVRAVSTSQYGVNASSSTNAAVNATSAKAFGVVAEGGTGGILAYTNSVTSPTGTGVWGDSNAGTAVRGDTGSGYAGHFIDSTGYGVFAESQNGVAFVGRTYNGNASDIQGTHIGLLGRAPASGFPLVLTDAAPHTLVQVDGFGNISYVGGLYHLTSTVGGGRARTFGPSATQPTIEDTGTAQLVNGVAVVRLDPTFSASIETLTAYRVFVTPAGDTRGLFVASRSPAGFVVRESQAGRSTVAFDYRVVATALGQNGQRMARINPAADTSLTPAPLPVRPTADTPAFTVPALSPPTP